MTVELRKGNRGNVNGTDLREINISGTIDPDIRLETQLPPDSNTKLVPWAYDKIRRDRSQVHGGKGRRDLFEEVCTVDGKDLPSGRGDELLELGEGSLWTALLELAALRLRPIQLLSVGIVPVGTRRLIAESIGLGGAQLRALRLIRALILGGTQGITELRGIRTIDCSGNLQA